MGEALLTGLLAQGWTGLAVVEKLDARRAELERRFPDVEVLADPAASEGAVVAVKPQDVAAACEAVGRAGVDRLLSIAAGVPLAKLEAALPPGTPVVRAMPNTPALVGAGAAAIAGGAAAKGEDLEWAESILGAVGTVTRVPESLLDAVTGLSGSGPAYVFLVAEALIAAGTAVGLPHDVSVGLTTQTLLGAARLLAETGQTPEDLRAQVTSPGGTTAAGVAVLEDALLRDAFKRAVEAATRRSNELGSQ